MSNQPMTNMRNPRCPHIRSKRIGEGEWLDYCVETERPSGYINLCLLNIGQSCKTWNEIQKEWENDARA